MFTFTVQYRYPYLNQVVSGPKWLNPAKIEIFTDFDPALKSLGIKMGFPK